MPIGRGGAGNYMEAQRVQDVVAEDVEAQGKVEFRPEPSRPAEYALSGRGGAGNIYSPKELVATGKFDTPVKTATAPPVRMGGRGGAGNFAYTEPAKDVQAEQDEKMRKIQEEVKREIEQQLAVPAKVLTPAAKME